MFDGTFAAALGEDAPQVLIVHTHGSEAYTMPPGEEYEDTGSFRTADASVSVIRVGDAAGEGAVGLRDIGAARPGAV